MHIIAALGTIKAGYAHRIYAQRKDIMPTPHNIRLIGLDLDGTTFTDDKRITLRTANAIAGAIARGVVVLPATGRQLTGVPEEFLQIPGVRYVLTSNGAKVYDLLEDKVLHSDCLTVQQALQIMDVCKQHQCLISVFIDGKSYTDEESLLLAEEFIPPEILEYFRNSRSNTHDLAGQIQQMGRPVEKFALNFKTENERQRANKDFLAMPQILVTSSMQGNLEINTATTHKGSGLIALGKHLGIQPQQIMAIGDSSNDEEMLKAVGYGVAMGNASAAIKAVADDVTLTNQEDGVAVAIEKVVNLA